MTIPASLPAHPFATAAKPPLRLAFVGQSLYFAACALEHPSGGVVPAFVDFRAGAKAEPMLAALREFDPDVVLVFRPEIVPDGAFAGVDALTVGFLTEPIPRTSGDAHPDLERRLDDLRMVDAANFDRIVTFDPLIASTADPIVPIWRSLPLPVADRFFLAPERRSRVPRALFIGRSTEHREKLLGPAKHEYDLIHIAHGVADSKLIEFFGEVDIGLNVHNEPYPSFENRVCLYAAAGLIVVTEPLSPTHGLEPGIDYLEGHSPEELFNVLSDVCRDVDAYRRVRIRGRAKAERFRASRVYPELLADLLRDVAVFGRRRL
jgi:hypothetical protein